jgi:hypothetical protein
MHSQINLDHAPGGYLLTAARGGEAAEISMREFTSSEDGDLFITRLDGLPSRIINMLPKEAGIQPSHIDCLLAVIDKVGIADIYINPSLEVGAKLKRAVEAGEAICEDDIASIETLKFQNIDIPVNCGVAVVISQGWRKGFYYDFTPINGDLPPRSYDLNSLLGSYLSYLTYQQIFKLVEDDWIELFKQQWFPFIGLTVSTTRKITDHIKNKWHVDDFIGEIKEDVDTLANKLIKDWSGVGIFHDHKEVFNTAVERYLDNDYISSTTLLFTRLEGLMRSINFTNGAQANTQKNLASAAIGGLQQKQSNFNRTLPFKFREYIEKIYFAKFSSSQKAALSRNSISHGVADSEDFSLKSAMIGILILNQILYYLPAINEPE